MTELSLHHIPMTLTLLPPGFPYWIHTVMVAHVDNPGKSHLKISCLVILILPCHASLHIYRLWRGDSDPFGNPLSVYHLMYSTFGEKKMTQIFIPHLSNCGRVEGHGIKEGFLMQSQSLTPQISIYSRILMLMVITHYS